MKSNVSWSLVKQISIRSEEKILRSDSHLRIHVNAIIVHYNKENEVFNNDYKLTDAIMW